MKRERNVFLIGPRACGKTTVGRLLAQRLGLRFVDTDHAVVQSVGMEIANYVDQNGWEGFRDKETETLAQVAAVGGQIIGCGGGIILREKNRAILKDGITLYLQTDPEILARRLTADPNEAQRPSLTGQSIVDEVKEILSERGHLYEGCADVILPQTELDALIDVAIREIELLP